MALLYSSGNQKHKGYHPDPYPVWALKRVDKPTTVIEENQISRWDEREGGFHRAGRGDFGPTIQREYRRFVIKHPLSGALMNMAKTLAGVVDGKTGSDRAPNTENPSKTARHIKEAAYFLRADLVGICELPGYAVFTHSRWTEERINLTHKYAIALLIDQDWRTSAAFNGHDWISNSMSFMSYSTSGFIACILAEYIRRLGYPARAHHAMNYQVVVPPLLLLAGLGEMCRIGDIVLNPFLGPRFKAAVVTTDLPLSVDKPIDFGLQDFCDKCSKCARECPSQAISYGDKVMYNGYERWSADTEQCTKMRVGNQHGSGCGTCLKVCPWSKPFTPFHRMINWTVRHVPAARKMAVLADDLWGYGKPKPDRKWWLDLEDLEGQIREPDHIQNNSGKF